MHLVNQLSWRLSGVLFLVVQASAATDYQRDVRPILAAHCFNCHGNDASKRKADLRLDTAEGALAVLKNGSRSIVPHDVSKSEVWLRINSSDPDEMMPPLKIKHRPDARELVILENWIKEGAAYSRHWAFEAPMRSDIPRNGSASPLDAFVKKAAGDQRLNVAPRADPVVQLRRLSFDLRGLPPSPEELEEFALNKQDDAWPKIVKKWMESPQFGEHWAGLWLDLARYGDTRGLHKDFQHSMWPYRDWVVSAFNRNMPFDQFTIEQLAGDLLPGATADQLTASGFNRCNASTDEAGIIEKEVVGSSRVDLQACKLEYSIVSPK